MGKSGVTPKDQKPPCLHRQRLIESNHEVTVVQGKPGGKDNKVRDQYTVDVYECDQFGKCTEKRKGPADSAVCAGCQFFHDTQDDSRPPLEKRKPGNWRKIPKKRLIDLSKLPVKPKRDNCAHLLSVLRTEPCKVCQNETRMMPVYGCEKHGECTLLRTGLTKQSCNKCDDYKER